MTVYVTQIDSKVGSLRLEASDEGLVSIQFKKTKKRDNHPVLKQASKELEEYFEGQLKKFKTPLVLGGTEFQKKCWNELLAIPYGETISYKEQAIKLGGSNYARAVAGANNKNNLPIIIPCHRVIGSNGALVGYAGGLKVKEQLLSIEK